MTNTIKDQERKYEVTKTNFQGAPHVCVRYGALKQYVTSERFSSYLEESEKMKRLAGCIIRDFPNYLYADDRADIRYTLALNQEDLAGDMAIGFVRATREQLVSVIGRATNLAQEGIPPIFVAEMESVKQRKDIRGFEYTHYPTLDAIINIFTRDHIGSKFDPVAARTNTGQIRFFRDYALRKAGIPMVRQEMRKRVEEIFSDRFQSEKSKEYVLECVDKGFNFLAEQLAQMPQSSKFDLKAFNPMEDSKSIVSIPFWYTRYLSSSIPLIISDYCMKFGATFLQGELENPCRMFSDYPGAEMVYHLFPEAMHIPELIETKSVREWDAKKYSSLNDSLVSRFSEEQLTVLQGRLAAHLNEGSLSDLNGTLEDICRTMGVSNTPLIHEKIVVPAIENSFLQKLSSCSESEIIDYFNQTHAYKISRYSHAQKALGRRLHTMIGKVGTKWNESFSRKALDLGFEEEAINQARKVYHARE